MIITLKRGDLFTYEYNGMLVDVAYDSTFDDSKELDTSKLYKGPTLLRVTRGSDVLWQKEPAQYSSGLY